MNQLGKGKLTANSAPIAVPNSKTLRTNSAVTAEPLDK